MILNDIERAVICGKQEYRTNADFIDAIEAAVLAKLSQGVSVEPVIAELVKEEMRYYHDGHYLDSSDAKYQLLGFAHRATRVAIAAARVQALEDAAVVAEYENAADWSVSGQIARRVRALKGGAA